MTMTLISTTTLASTSATIVLSSLPATYTDMLIVYALRDTGTNGTEAVHNTVYSFNGSTSNFSTRYLAGSNTSKFSGTTPTNFGGWHPDAGATSSTFGNSSLYIPNYAGSANKSYSVEEVTENNGSTTYMSIVAGLWSQTAAITSVTLNTLGTAYEIGSTVSVYGILKGSGGATVS